LRWSILSKLEHAARKRARPADIFILAVRAARHVAGHARHLYAGIERTIPGRRWQYHRRNGQSDGDQYREQESEESGRIHKTNIPQQKAS
jgi:hypothetical protein